MNSFNSCNAREILIRQIHQLSSHEECHQRYSQMNFSCKVLREENRLTRQNLENIITRYHIRHQSLQSSLCTVDINNWLWGYYWEIGLGTSKDILLITSLAKELYFSSLKMSLFAWGNRQLLLLFSSFQVSESLGLLVNTTHATIFQGDILENHIVILTSIV